MMIKTSAVRVSCVSLVVLACALAVRAWSPVPITDDPLVRMPGTQSGDVEMDAPKSCLMCHGSKKTDVGSGFDWKGSMMAQSGRDFIFWAAMTVAGQDSVWAVGRPNAMDICIRCHFPEGWYEGRSDPVNVSAMENSDFDGVHCDVCHTMYDPFFADTHSGKREGDDWAGYWDEANAGTPSSETAAETTRDQDAAYAKSIKMFNGTPFYGDDGKPVSSGYTENGAGQLFLTGDETKRGPFADARPSGHDAEYSRHEKSKYFCGACHDVSNPVLANMEFADARPGDGTTVLVTESKPAFSYFHSERTFSEFMLSAYAQPGGVAGHGPFAPEKFETSLANNHIARCQDCHMRNGKGKGAKFGKPVLRPDESLEHPQSGQPAHDMVGGNMFVAAVMASTVSRSANYDKTNAELFNRRKDVLTLDPDAGLGIDAAAMLAYVDAAKGMLESAAEIDNTHYNATTGELSFRILNLTGHKLISGFPEGRRMFVNIKTYKKGSLIHEINPYAGEVGTLKGLDGTYAASSPSLGENERYVDELVYEMHASSALTGEKKTFHFALATGRYKDNRIPPRGFRIGDAAERLVEPVWHGEVMPDYFTAEEYEGGFDSVSVNVAAGADKVEVRLYYQTTSREYMEFLRDEINGAAATLASPAPSGEPRAYIIQTDPFFARMKGWGDTVWQLWLHNKDMPGAAPVLMAETVVD
jgi:hypothetical protein